ncbi:SPS1 protein [Gonium pectorale]|uniref:SPS1 protein n=1 Tax=Gonium pectorale TaxID=33097 RepID=A0A150H4I6_GONPE|nr:SPS1 protein [Gonium pectorale]|eukprot:KXZ57047.1 SPS1 protein [Gonium pectorale]
MSSYAKRLWLEEDLGDDYRWSYRVSAVLFSEEVEDGVREMAAKQVYHELLVHPPLLHHKNPKRVFIMGGGEGATAREVLRHASVEKVVMVDIDQVVTDFCSRHLERNTDAFRDPRLTLINDDARVQLEVAPDESFDIIISDLADPLDGGPCYQLYTQTLLTEEQLDSRIAQQLGGRPLTFLDGATFTGLRQLNKVVREALESEKEVYTADSARFIHGSGLKA